MVKNLGFDLQLLGEWAELQRLVHNNYDARACVASRQIKVPHKNGLSSVSVSLALHPTKQISAKKHVRELRVLYRIRKP